MYIIIFQKNDKNKQSKIIKECTKRVFIFCGVLWGDKKPHFYYFPMVYL